MIPKFSTSHLLDDLTADVREILLQTEQLKSYTEDQLRQKPDEDSWSMVEVLAHLNYYARYYINAIEGKLHGHETQTKPFFRSGWLGNYFTTMMEPSPYGEPARKMKTFKGAVPKAPAHLDPKEEVTEFTGHQYQLLNLLKIAGSADLERLRIPITISRFIRLKLGDTFRFLIAHQQRHFQQIDRVKHRIVRQLQDI